MSFEIVFKRIVVIRNVLSTCTFRAWWSVAVLLVKRACTRGILSCGLLVIYGVMKEAKILSENEPKMALVKAEMDRA